MAKRQESDDRTANVHKEQEDLHRRLLQERDDLVDQIKELSSSSLIANRQAGEEMADIGSDDFLREMELALVGEEEKTFVLIQEALERLEQGSYGTCVDCTGPISRGRLQAIPYAKLCIECKAKREERGGAPPPEIPEDEQEELVE